MVRCWVVRNIWMSIMLQVCKLEFKNIAKSSPWISIANTVCVEDLKVVGGRCCNLIRKSVAFMTNPAQKESKPGELVSDTFAGTLSLTKVCEFFNKHRTFVKFEKNSGCLKFG